MTRLHTNLAIFVAATAMLLAGIAISPATAVEHPQKRSWMQKGKDFFGPFGNSDAAQQAKLGVLMAKIWKGKSALPDPISEPSEKALKMANVWLKYAQDYFKAITGMPHKASVFLHPTNKADNSSDFEITFAKIDRYCMMVLAMVKDARGNGLNEFHKWVLGLRSRRIKAAAQALKKQVTDAMDAELALRTEPGHVSSWTYQLDMNS